MAGEVKVNIFPQVDTKGAQSLRGTCGGSTFPALWCQQSHRRRMNHRGTHTLAAPAQSPSREPHQSPPLAPVPPGPLSQNVGGQTGALSMPPGSSASGAALGCQARGSQGRSSWLTFCGSCRGFRGKPDRGPRLQGRDSPLLRQRQGLSQPRPLKPRPPFLTLPEAGCPRSRGAPLPACRRAPPHWVLSQRLCCAPGERTHSGISPAPSRTPALLD